jgi:hypothetical protein
MRQDLLLQTSGLVMMDGKSALCGVSPLPLFDRRLLDLAVRGEWLLRSLKLCMARAFAGVPTHYCQFSAVFNLQTTKTKQMKMAANMLFYVILFIIGCLTACCSLLVLSFVFLENYKI